MIDMTVDEALAELTAANFHSEYWVLRDRIDALENACQAYLDDYDNNAFLDGVEPVIRKVMEGCDEA